MTILMKVQKLILQGIGIPRNETAALIKQKGALLREAAEWYINGACTLESAVYMVKHY